MLSLETLQATRDLVTILADKDVTLVPVPDSPLADLVRTTRKEVTCGITDLGGVDGLALDLYHMNEPAMCDGAPVDDMHTAVLGRCGELLGQSLAKHVDFTMTTILPAVGRLAEGLAAIEAADCLTGPKAYRIEQLPATALFDISDIVDELEQSMRAAEVEEIPLVLDFENGRTDEELLAMLRNGSETFDLAVADFVSRIGMDLVRETWKQIFSASRDIRNFTDFLVDGRTRIGRQMAIFLFARSIFNGELPAATGTGGLSRAKYRTVLRDLIDSTGKSLCIAMTRELKEDQQGKVIDRIEGKVVYVNKRVYDRFLAEGGDVEVLLGSAVSKKDMFIESMLEHANVYREAWAYQVGIEKQTAKQTQVTDSRRAIVDFTRLYLLETRTTDVVLEENFDRIMDRVRAYANDLYQGSLKDLHEVSLIVVCDLIYRHTDACAMLSAYTDAVQSNPEMSKDQAMGISLATYLGDWVSNQISVA